MRIRLVLIVLFTIIPFHKVMAQDVEGVDIHQKMTEAQIFEKFGEPDKVESKVDDVGVVTMMYYYGVNEVFFTDGFLTEFLIKLGVSQEIASDDACKIEHHISDESFEAIKKAFSK